MKLGLAVLSIFAVIHGGLSCSCRETPITDKFCKYADFVVGATMLTGLTKLSVKTGYDAVYIVQIFEVYKTNKGVNMRVGREESIFTRSSSAGCGLDNLQAGQSYILSGNYDKEKGLKLFPVNICTSIYHEVVTPPTDVTQGGGHGKKQPKYIPTPILAYPEGLVSLLDGTSSCEAPGNNHG